MSDRPSRDPGAPAYVRDSALRRLETEVVDATPVDGGVEVVLADTLFYPEGGGQPADSGTLDGVPVLDVFKRDGVVRHLVERAPRSGSVILDLDWRRRFDHMQQHTAQHLVTAIAQDRFGLATTAFHLGPRQSDIELDAPSLDEALHAEIEAAANEEIRRGRLVTTEEVDAAEATRRGARTRGLAAGHVGPIRLVRIEEVDLATCGGTHVRSLAELQAVKLLGTEPMRGGTRLHFLAGDRVLRRLGEHEARAATLRRLLDVPDDEIADAAAARLDQLVDARRRMRSLEEELALSAAARLAASGDAVAGEHRGEADMASLQATGRAFVELRPSGAVLLTAGTGGKGCFVLAVGPDLDVDLGALGRGVAELLGGRGGGRPPLFQGKAARPEALDEAVDWIRGHLA